MNLKEIIDAAERGDAKAQWRLGWRYEKGRGMERSDEEAVRWFRKAAERGVVDDLNELFKLLDLMEKAEQGDARAQYKLADRYDRDFFGVSNHEKAAKWYRKAAEQGYGAAQLCLGFHYSRGDGVEQSDEEATKWIEKAVAQGSDRYAEEKWGGELEFTEAEALDSLYERRFLEHMKRSLLAQKRPAG
jgi:TPR repeat protein